LKSRSGFRLQAYRKTEREKSVRMRVKERTASVKTARNNVSPDLFAKESNFFIAGS